MKKEKRPANEYYTGEGVDIEQRLLDGETVFFKSRVDADKFATERRSYVYDVFDSPTIIKNHIGYGVPN